MRIAVKKIAQLTGHRGAIFAVCEGETPSFVLSAGGDGWMVKWDLEQPDTGKLIAQADANLFSMFYLKTENLIIAGNKDGGVHFIDLNNSDNTRNILHHKKGVFDIQVIDNQLYTIGGDGYLTIWDIFKRQAVESIQVSGKSLRTMVCRGDELVIGASDDSIYFLNKNTLEITHTIENAHNNSVFSLAFSPDNHYLLSGGRDAMLNIYTNNFKTFKKIQTLPAHRFTINNIVFHPENPLIFATASRDKTIKIWQLTEGGAVLLKVIDTIRHGCHTHSVNRLLWSRHHNWLISASDDRTLIIWEIKI
jgi:WD40 repeat protein